MAFGFKGPLVVAAVLILLIGHGLNIVMGLLSVVVHGVRLNLLEFSGQLGMEWAGIAYHPFKKGDKIKNKRIGEYYEYRIYWYGVRWVCPPWALHLVPVSPLRLLWVHGKCYANGKPAPFIMVAFSGAPLTQTIYGFLLMNFIRALWRAAVTPCWLCSRAFSPVWPSACPPSSRARSLRLPQTLWAKRQRYG